MINKRFWGKKEQKDICLFTLHNDNGMEVDISDFGSTIVSIRCPSSEGTLADVVLGFDELEGYLEEHPYFGSTVGRYASRIFQGKFEIDGIIYQLPVNDGSNCLHGGIKGFDKYIWDTEVLGNQLVTRRISLDGEEGFPGNLLVEVAYVLTNKNELIIEYSASTDKKTALNLTDHSYFNLQGGDKNILDHELTIYSSKIALLNENSIPTGEFLQVENTPFDFRSAQRVGDRMKMSHPQFEKTKSFDHSFALENNGNLIKAATLLDPQSNRRLTVYTTEPSVHLYTGNFLNGTTGKGGKEYSDFYALCLETQHFPNSLNQDNFPSTILNPGETFYSKTIYAFSW